MSFKKIILYLLLILLLVFGIWMYKLIWGKPLHINHFFERSLIEVALAEPELLTVVGIVDNTMFDFHSHKLSDASPDYTKETMKRSRRQLQTLRSYNRERLTGQKALSYDIFEWFLEATLDGERWMFHDYPVNQTFGIQTLLPNFMDTYHQVVDEKSAENFISRLTAFEEKFRQVRESVIYRAERGVIPPRFVIDHVLKEMKNFIDKDPAEHSLSETFREKLSEAENISEERKQELETQAAQAIEESVFTGYQILISTFEELQEKAGNDDGVWALPDGDEFYEYSIRYHTTLPLTAEQIHQTGLAEVERIREEMFVLFDEINITEGTVAERFSKLKEMPGMFYEDAEENYARILDDYSEMIEILYERSAPLFNRKPQAGIEVRRVPENAEETAPFAYYSIPSLDGSRPGIFFANLRNIDEIPKYGMMTLAAHEGVPGHHFQLALQQEIEGVPTFRNIIPFTAYVEGWALYTEWLVSEIGMYDDDPYSDLGRLQGEMFRAVRLVVDTGIHSKRWTREESIEYLYDNTGLPYDDVVSEIERYIVMPGQALAYKIGMNHIQELRELAETELEDQFDIAGFHDVILMNGSMPLDLLTRVVQDYIQEH